MSDIGATTPETKRKWARVTVAQRAEAVALQRAGEMTSQEIADKVGLSITTVRHLFNKVKVKKGEGAVVIEEKRAAVIAESITLDPLVYAQRVFNTKNETYRITEMLRKLVASEVVKCRQDGRKLGTIQNEIKTIVEAAKAIKICREEAYAVLGIRPDDQGDEQLPDLTITDLTEDDIADLQAMPAVEDMGDVPDLPLASSEGDLDVNEGVDGDD